MSFRETPSKGDEGGHDWAGFLTDARTRLRASATHSEATELFRTVADAPLDVEGYRGVSVGILRNTTVEPWLPELYLALLRRGIHSRLWTGDFDVFERYAAGGLPSDLDCLIVLLDGAAAIGDARYRPPPDLAGALIDRLDGLVAGLRAATGATVVLANLAPEAHELHAPHAHQDPASWPSVRRAVNVQLVERHATDPQVALLDLDRVVSSYGCERAYDQRMLLTTRNPYAVDFFPELGGAVARVVAASVLVPKKCVVVDCDNTLWGGILGEDGPSGLSIGDTFPGSAYRGFQLFLKGLRDRGVLLAINSKNNEGDVREFIGGSPDMVLGMDDFAAYRINWRDKASNLRELAAELNIGLDAIMLIDDSAVECELVRSMIPEAQVERFPENPMEIEAFCASLENLERLAVTADDLKRSESIRANAQRERLREDAPDLASFIESLAIEVTITKQDRSSVERISQLTQRTNQFNATTRRYTTPDIMRWLDEGIVYSMRMRDRFSDYGMVGVAIARTHDGGETEVDTFLLSCRAFGRGVEEALLAAVVEDAAARGSEAVAACYLPTAKNGMVRDFFGEQGFGVVLDTETERRFRIDLEGWDAPSGEFPFRIERVGF